MAIEVGTAYISILPSTDKLAPAIRKELSTVERESGKTGSKAGGGFLSGFKKAVGPLAAIGATIGAGALLKGTITEASDLGESVNALNVTYGKNSKAIQKLGQDAANALGLSNVEFNGLAVRFSGFTKTIAGKGGNVVGTLDDLTTRASDFASVMNLEVNEAAELFQSGLAGETEPLRKFGIDLSAATVQAHAYKVGIAESGDELTEQQKVQARYSLLMKSTNKTQGDFANTSDSLANVQRRLKSTFKDIQAEVGSYVLPMLEKFGAWMMNTGIPAARDFGKWFKEYVVPVLKDFGGVIKNDIIPGVKGAWEWIVKWQNVLVPLAAGLLAGVAAFKAFMFIKKVILAVKAARIAVLAFNASLLANPIGIVIAVLVGLAVALVVAYKKSDTFRAIVDKAWKTVKDTVVGAWEKGIKPAFDALKTFIMKTLPDAFRKGVDKVGNFWEGLKKAAQTPVKFVVDTLYNNGLRKMIGYLPGVDTPSAVNLGFARGGYTGPGGKYEPAGIVHRDEFVVRKESRSKFERQNPGALDYLNRYGTLPGFFLGGRVPASGGMTQHSGYPWAWWAGDINVPGDETGNPVRAWKAGVVAATNFWTTSYGRHVRINHPDNSNSLYAHLSSIGVTPGQQVSAGQMIGRVGNTGNSFGAHLHFEAAGGKANFSGASGGSGDGGGLFGIDIGGIVSTAKEVWNGLKGMADSGWAKVFKDSLTGSLGKMKDWVNDKVPGPGPLMGIFDNGGVLAPGMFAYNASKKPEAVFNQRQFKQFAEGRTASDRPAHFDLHLDRNSKMRLHGYVSEIAEDTYNGERAYEGTTRRMGGR